MDIQVTFLRGMCSLIDNRKPPETVGCIVPDNSWQSTKVYTKPGTARGVMKNHRKDGKLYIGTVKWTLDGTQTPISDEKKGMELLTDAINAKFGSTIPLTNVSLYQATGLPIQP